MELVSVYMCVGVFLAAYSVIANDSAQTLGTFISSNKKTAWWKSWAYMSTIMILTLGYAWWGGDIAYSRLDSIPRPLTFQWYHGFAPLLLLGLTRYGIPVSTTLLTLSVFSSSVACAWMAAPLVSTGTLGFALIVTRDSNSC